MHAYTVGLSLSYLDNTSATAESYAFLCAAPSKTRGHALYFRPRKKDFGRNFDGPLLRLDTDSSSVNFCIFPPDLGLHESTVGVALDSYIAERKPVRAHGGRKSVVYSNYRIIASLILRWRARSIPY